LLLQDQWYQSEKTWISGEWAFNSLITPDQQRRNHSWLL
jgi:hypothetical protein